MPVITIPFDYDPRRESNCVIPIYLNDTDNNGEKIFFGWIEAVVPVQDKLRALSIRVLGDVWRVSELTELTVHHLCTSTGRTSAVIRAFACTRRRNERRMASKIRARAHLALNISLDAIEEYRKDALIANTADTERGYRINLDLQRIERKLKEVGRRNEIEVYRMLKAGYYWSEIGERVGEHPNTVYRRFRRLLRRIIDIV